MKTILLGLLLGLAACAYAQTPEGYKAQMSSGTYAAFGSITHMTIPLAYSTVVSNLRKPVANCLDDSAPGFVTSSTALAVPQSWHARLNETSANGQIIVQQSSAYNAPGAPEGGPYVFVADIVPLSATSTEITGYRAAMGRGRDYMDRIKAWAQGDTDCHDSFF